MSNSILYHGLGVSQHKYLKMEYSNGSLIFHIEKPRNRQCCAVCSSEDVISKGVKERKIRTLPLGKKPVFLMVHLHRLYCNQCGALRMESLPLTLPKRRWTKQLGRYIIELLEYMTIKDVADHLNMSWDTVKEIHLWALKQKFKKRKIKHLRYLGVDEIAVRKGHNYLTIVIDLESGEVVRVAEGRKIESLAPFLERLKRAGVPIKAVAMDMWPAYMTAVLTYYPSNVIVFDKYHIISDCNKMLDELRQHEASVTPKLEKKAFIGVKYLLLKGSEKIQDNELAKKRLDELLRINEPLNIAYVLKEELRNLWNCESYEEAENYLNNWLQKAWASNVLLIMKFANKIAGHRLGILNFFLHRITTGKVEGINNKIKTLKRQCYGFRDMEYFKLRIYFINNARYSLVG